MSLIRKSIPELNALDIKPYTFKGQLNQVLMEMKKIIFHFFFNPSRIDIPFRGFLLEGPPGTGKTELAKQTARLVAEQLKEKGKKLKYLLVDSANIAAARWGDAENAIKNLFKISNDEEVKHILILDDIDCIMIKRGSTVAVEWHYSINSVLFHELDRINPTNVIVIATSNRTDLIDDALRSRLYFYEIKPIPLGDLKKIAWDIIKSLSITGKKDLETRVNESLDQLAKEIEEKKIQRDPPNIRDIQHFITKIYVKEMLK